MQPFFVLIFGQIENRLNELAARRVGSDAGRRAATRELPFERRLERALPSSENETLRGEIAKWYGLRNDAAYGERMTSYNIETVFERAFELDGLVNAQMSQAGRQEEQS